MLKNIYYYSLLFGIGAFGYGLIELLWRGYTHPTMSLAGGISICAISIIQRKLKPLKFVYRCIASGLFITAVELVFGVIFNLLLNMQIWDYSTLYLNFLGQISFLFFIIWCILSAPILILTELVRDFVYKNDRKTKKQHPLTT